MMFVLQHHAPQKVSPASSADTCTQDQRLCSIDSTGMRISSHTKLHASFERVSTWLLQADWVAARGRQVLKIHTLTHTYTACHPLQRRETSVTGSVSLSGVSRQAAPIISENYNSGGDSGWSEHYCMRCNGYTVTTPWVKAAVGAMA
eukprot:1159088-Pelagomonas_calceolata.AAC.10